MPKLLVTTPRNIQKIIQIGINGAYFDNRYVDWDERIHGALPDFTELGGIERYIDHEPVLDPKTGEQIIDTVYLTNEEGHIIYTDTPMVDERGDPLRDDSGNIRYIPQVKDIPRTREVIKTRVNAEKKALHDAAVLARQEKKQEKQNLNNDISTRRQQVRALIPDWDNVTTAQLKAIVRYLLMKDLRE